ncbi:MAG TPA: cytochrome C biogenesis protein CcdA [Planctomycetaceae bacterium]|nr:cytochrome C biogenesis protein CcdA [Planctomycetaceae bacterium]
MSSHVEVTTTTASRDDARRIARALVERRLAACVQIRGPIESIYRWQGNIETAEEWQCVAKTRRELFAQVEQAIRELHPYEVPEILAVEIVATSDAYGRWLEEELGAGD